MQNKFTLALLTALFVPMLFSMETNAATNDLTKENHTTEHSLGQANLFPLNTNELVAKEEPGDPSLVYFWFFDGNIPNDTPLENLDPQYSLPVGAELEYRSALAGYPFDVEHPNWRKASMERRNAPTPVNYRPEGNNNLPYNEADMRGIQIKQPFTGDGGENTLVFHLPTSGIEDVVFRFAAKDEGAADAIIIDYATEGETWTTAGLSQSSFSLSPDFQLFEISFLSLEATNQNPDFKIRLRFSGSDMTADVGNRVTFNNFSLDGTIVGNINFPPQVSNPPGLQTSIENAAAFSINLNEVFTDPEGMPLTYSAHSNRPAFVSVTIDGSSLSLTPLRRGDALITISASDGENDAVFTQFRTLVYPQGYNMADGNFTFGTWSAEQAEYTYPEHMLFLQSEVADPGLNADLLFPYHIPHDDYHDDDLGNLGFPYKNTRRTRINGLGDEGIAFINTGRNRDLGGALLAINTQGHAALHVNWVAATLAQNFRIYGIRLQYRIGTEGNFTDVMKDGQPMQYITNVDGHATTLGFASLPQQILNQDYVQLLWRYFHLDGNTGARPQLRLDDIMITSSTNAPETEADNILIYATRRSIIIQNHNSNQVVMHIYNLMGQQLYSQQIQNSGTTIVNTSLPAGIYIVKLESPGQSISKKLILQ